MERDRDKGNFDSRNSPGKVPSSKQVSFVQVDVQLQERNTPLDPESSVLIGMTLETWL